MALNAGFWEAFAGHLEAIAREESGTLGVGWITDDYENEIVRWLINRAVEVGGEHAEEMGRIDMIIIEERFRFILAVLARVSVETGDRQGLLNQDTLGFVFDRLCPLWPFC
jgi:hypothetical protein